MHNHHPHAETHAIERNRPLQQDMQAYTAEDKAVWTLLYNRQMSRLPQLASADVLKGLQTLGFRAESIPSFAAMNKLLLACTGWQLTVVPCLCPAETFFTLLARKTFTATCWLRKMDELDYLEEPDMFHDVFGHAPLLSHPAYTAFFEALGHLGLRYGQHPKALEILERLYWFTIEFGMIEEGSSQKLYGAGILSSAGETNHALSSQSQKLPFCLQTLANTPFRTDVLQDKYFVISSFEQLKNCLPQLESMLKTASRLPVISEMAVH